MNILKSLFGMTRYPKETDSMEAYDIAKATIMEKFSQEACTARLCCIYTSVMESNDIIEDNGKTRAWHFDFYLPESRSLYLVRLENGKIKIRHKKWPSTSKKPVEYIFAVYGIDLVSEPVDISGKITDSKDIFKLIKPLVPENYCIGMFCYPAIYMRYLQDEKCRTKLGFPHASGNALGIICSGDDLYDEDSILFYIDPIKMEVLEQHKFRYPGLFFFGTSVDW